MSTATTTIHTSYLGPATVTDTRGDDAQVRLPTGALVWARVALAFPYRPVPDDVLLVVGTEEAHYIIGVLHGTGTAALDIHGDVHLHAVGGTLRLSGDAGVQIDGPDVEVRAQQKLTLAAHTFVKKVGVAYEWVKGLLSRRAGRSRTLVHGQCTTHAQEISVIAKDVAKINGRQVHLGS